MSATAQTTQMTPRRTPRDGLYCRLRREPATTRFPAAGSSAAVARPT